MAQKQLTIAGRGVISLCKATLQTRFFMKRIKSVLMCGVVLAFAGAPTMLMAAAMGQSGNATVRSIHGSANYSVNGGQPAPLRPNTELPEGAVITTSADTIVDLQVNGHSSTVRITSDTTITLQKMIDLGAGDSETSLKLANGTILGSVKKISKASKYEIETPRGVAGIRGTDFAVSCIPQGNGQLPVVTFSSVTGTVVCVAMIQIGNNPTPQPVEKILTSGQSWTPPVSAPSEISVTQQPPSPLPPLPSPPPPPPAPPAPAPTPPAPGPPVVPNPSNPSST
jgi:hypothetical protein